MKKPNLKIGDLIRIHGLPDLSGMSSETIEIFQLCLGKSFTIVDFNEYGLLEIQADKLNTIWIEPELVEKVDG